MQSEKITKDTLIDLITKKDFKIVFNDGIYLDVTTNTILEENDVKQEIAKIIAKPTPASIDAVIGMMRIFKEKQNVWKLWQDNMEKKCKEFNIDGKEMPSLFLEFFPDVANLKDALSAIVKGIAGKVIIMQGVANAGKSVIIKILRELFGILSINRQIEDFNDKHAVAGLYGKLLCSGADLGEESIEGRSGGRFKQLITGEGVTANPKGKELFDMVSNANYIFGCNDIPRYNVLDVGLQRRFLLIKFNKILEINTVEDYYDILDHLTSPRQLCILYKYLKEYKHNLDDAVHDMQMEQVMKFKDLAWRGGLVTSPNWNKKYTIGVVSYEDYKRNCEEDKDTAKYRYGKKRYQKLCELLPKLCGRELLR